MTKRVPKLITDEDAEAFLAQDLSDLDFSQFKPMRLEPETERAGKAPFSPEMSERK
ncbi:CopG family antitoxin [Caulobacter vibrioides]|uniref:CopG family antitoxin n=1 Tax=Caulobacter vibrioides TaxID=155892 RepID=UPI000F74118B|nr:CopG family antitoxin [Caulobacter vibrioides]